MGYYTNHNLKIHKIDNEEINNNEDLNEKLEDKINEAISSHEDMSYAVGSVTEDWYCDSCKWYKHREDMIEFSKLFPDVVFELEGEGENSGDVWKEYYKNGKYQYCPAKITFDEYNHDELKEMEVSGR